MFSSNRKYLSFVEVRDRREVSLINMENTKKLNVVECDGRDAHQLLETGEYLIINSYVIEHPGYNITYDGTSGTGYIERSLVYCLAKKQFIANTK